MEWILYAFVFLLTLPIAGTGLYFSYYDLLHPKVEKYVSSIIKVGESLLEVSTDVVGILILAISLIFFILAGTWFHSSFSKSKSDTEFFTMKINEFLAKQTGQYIPRDDLLNFISRPMQK